MAVKVGINGFGRIGRNVLRASHRDPGIDFVAVNDITDPKTLAHLLKYDSVLGTLDAKIGHGQDCVTVNGRPIRVFKVRDPGEIDWPSFGAEIVLESTGLFTEAEQAKKHLRGTVKKVIITAPAKNEDITVVLGVNEDKYDPAKHKVISNASCTTNCLAPVAKVVHESFKIKNGSMTTIHAYTNDQRILDLPHSDLRRARAAALSIIPTTTGAAKAVGLVLPELKGKLDGYAIRVPTINVSIVDLSFIAARDTSVDEVNAVMKSASDSGPLAGLLGYNTSPLVSIDFNHDPRSSVFDSTLTKVSGRLVKVSAWYDNEWGFSNRMLDTTMAFMAAK